MFGNKRDTERSEEKNFELLEELELNQPAQVEKRRSTGRFRTKAECSLRPANRSDRDRFTWKGETREFDSEGLRAVFDRPVGVGDVFFLGFSEEVSVESGLALCTSCEMTSDTEFAIALQFVRAAHVSVDAAQTAGSGV